MSESIEIDGVVYILTKKVLNKIEVLVREDFAEEYKLLEKINDNLSFEGKESGLDYRVKKKFRVDENMPKSCHIHFSNDNGDHIYIFNDKSIEIGKSFINNSYSICQLSYQNIIDIAKYCEKKIIKKTVRNP